MKNLKSKNNQSVVAYWMSRDQRVQDNNALYTAQQEALKNKSKLIVVFNINLNFPNANNRSFNFMFKGLKKLAVNLEELDIPFIVLYGDPEETLPKFITNNNVTLLISDFSPLKIAQEWKNKVNSHIQIKHIVVDAHNLIPVWQVSGKQEYSAFTFRRKYQKILKIIEPPSIIKHPYNKKERNVFDYLPVVGTINENITIISGEDIAHKVLNLFINSKINNYAQKRNDPNAKVLSELSVYLHFGQISSQRVAFEIKKLPENENTKSFLEEIIIRKELSDNYCYYNSNYDNFEGFPNWGKKTLLKHANDARQFIYSLDAFENAKTHDDLWNAAQSEMVKTGKMHGYMRMYWCKKILEWTKDPYIAQEYAIYLNDKYSLDGRDPNGYTGIAWSIGGVHDRPWFERPIFGQIRYMNYSGALNKFDVNSYISTYLA